MPALFFVWNAASSCVLGCLMHPFPKEISWMDNFLGWCQGCSPI